MKRYGIHNVRLADPRYDETQAARQYYGECKQEVRSLEASATRKEARLQVESDKIRRLSYRQQIKEIRRLIRITQNAIYSLENPPDWAGYTASDLLDE